MIFLALIPTVVLLIYIYKKDTREKESKRLLLQCFFYGVLSAAPAVVIELAEDSLIFSHFTSGTFAYAFIESFVVAAVTEEVFKYIFLSRVTWKSPEYNCRFDGIVYAVFIGLGFAAIENILYLIGGSVFDALLRMLTAIPGHMGYAVFMGYFYSRAKQGSLYNNKKMVRRNKFLAVLVPVILHGIYDALLTVEEEVVGEAASAICMVLWFVFLAVFFVVSFKLINRTSKEDMPFSMQRVTWECKCGNINNGNFCNKCGARKLSMRI